MSLSLKQIRYFLAAAKTGQISLAARELNVSQSAVTAAIQQLEATIGDRLFERGPSGVLPTREGSRFLQNAQNIMSAVEEALHTPRSSDISVKGTVRVGVTYTVAGYFFPRHHARFSRSFPGISLKLFEAPRAKIEQALVEGELDIAVMLVSNLTLAEELESETLLRSERRLWAPHDHPLLSADKVGLREVSRFPYVMLTVDEAHITTDRYWSRSAHDPNTIFKTTSVEAVRSMVAAGMGVTILSDMVYRPWSLEGQRIERRILEDQIPTMNVGLAWSRRRDQSVATRAFHDFLSLSFTGG